MANKINVDMVIIRDAEFIGHTINIRFKPLL